MRYRSEVGSGWDAGVQFPVSDKCLYCHLEYQDGNHAKVDSGLTSILSREEVREWFEKHELQLENEKYYFLDKGSR